MEDKKIRIGFVSDYFNSEYAANLIKGVKNFCVENNVELLLFQLGDIANKNPLYNNFEYAAVASHLKSKNLDGLIVTASTFMHSLTIDEYVDYLKQFEPLKIVNIAAELPGIHSVVSDCSAAYEALLNYVIKNQKCRKLALMGVDSQSPEVIERTEIFRNVLKKNGIDPDSATYFKSKFDYSTAYSEISIYNKDHKGVDFDAIIALNDDSAFACMDFCTKRVNLNVPQDIIITGFDNIQRCSFCSPTLSSVNQQIEYIGFTAAQTIYNLLNEKEVPLLQKVKAQAILRTSTAKNREIQKAFIDNDNICVDKRSAKDFSNTFTVSEWYNKRNQIMQAANFFNAMDTNILIGDLGPVLVHALRAFGFQGGMIVVYDHPVETPTPFDFFKFPDKAKVIAGFDYDMCFTTNNLTEPVTFNPSECVLPPGIFRMPPSGSIVIALFHNFIQYGYMVLRCDAYDYGVYDIIQHSVSNLLDFSYFYTKLQNEHSQMKDQNSKLNLIAHTDELTGLNNRRGFMDFGQLTLNNCKTIKQGGLVVVCDLDGLKKINDNYGHEDGDLAIKAIAEILNSTFRSNDILGRLGGDEFVLICPGLSESNFNKIKKRIKKSCRTWSKLHRSKFTLSLSSGTVTFPDAEHGYDMEYLLGKADEAMYEEKRKKKHER